METQHNVKTLITDRLHKQLYKNLNNRIEILNYNTVELESCKFYLEIDYIISENVETMSTIIDDLNECKTKRKLRKIVGRHLVETVATSIYDNAYRTHHS